MTGQMRIDSTIKQLKRLKADPNLKADDYNAIATAIRGLAEWQELKEEIGRVQIKNRDDLHFLIGRHIGRLE